MCHNGATYSTTEKNHQKKIENWFDYWKKLELCKKKLELWKKIGFMQKKIGIMEKSGIMEKNWNYWFGLKIKFTRLSTYEEWNPSDCCWSDRPG